MDTPAQATFRRLVRRLLRLGIKPTHTKILEHQDAEGYKFVWVDCAPYGRKTRALQLGEPYRQIRIDEFEKAGWVRGEQYWGPPEKT